MYRAVASPSSSSAASSAASAASHSRSTSSALAELSGDRAAGSRPPLACSSLAAATTCQAASSSSRVSSRASAAARGIAAVEYLPGRDRRMIGSPLAQVPGGPQQRRDPRGRGQLIARREPHRRHSRAVTAGLLIGAAGRIRLRAVAAR